MKIWHRKQSSARKCSSLRLREIDISRHAARRTRNTSSYQIDLQKTHILRNFSTPVKGKRVTTSPWRFFTYWRRLINLSKRLPIPCRTTFLPREDKSHRRCKDEFFITQSIGTTGTQQHHVGNKFWWISASKVRGRICVDRPPDTRWSEVDQDVSGFSLQSSMFHVSVSCMILMIPFWGNVKVHAEVTSKALSTIENFDSDWTRPYSWFVLSCFPVSWWRNVTKCRTKLST